MNDKQLQLIEAVRNLLSIEYREGWATGQPVCEDCIRLHAMLVLQHAERAEAAECSGR